MPQYGLQIASAIDPMGTALNLGERLSVQKRANEAAARQQQAFEMEMDAAEAQQEFQGMQAREKLGPVVGAQAAEGSVDLASAAKSAFMGQMGAAGIPRQLLEQAQPEISARIDKMADLASRMSPEGAEAMLDAYGVGQAAELQQKAAEFVGERIGSQMASGAYLVEGQGQIAPDVEQGLQGIGEAVEQGLMTPAEALEADQEIRQSIAAQNARLQQKAAGMASVQRGMEEIGSPDDPRMDQMLGLAADWQAGLIETPRDLLKRKTEILTGLKVADGEDPMVDARREAVKALTSQYGRTPTEEEVQEHMKVSLGPQYQSPAEEAVEGAAPPPPEEAGTKGANKLGTTGWAKAYKDMLTGGDDPEEVPNADRVKAWQAVPKPKREAYVLTVEDILRRTGKMPPLAQHVQIAQQFGLDVNNLPEGVYDVFEELAQGAKQDAQNQQMIAEAKALMAGGGA